MNRVDLNRRHFLKLVGAGALTYPFLRGVPSYAAGNNGGTDPIYLVLLFTPNGCIRYRWGALGPPPASASPTATGVTNGPLTFRQTLSAFTKAGATQTDLTKYITVLDGLQNKAAGIGTHETGMATLWTGLTGMGTSTSNNGPSIDQVIASQLKASTPYQSVAMVVQSSADYYQSRSVDNRMSYDLTGNMVDPIASSPADTINKLFPAPVAMTGPDKTTFIRQQVANHINADLTRLQGRLCTQDRVQLQNLQDLWNTVQSQLAAAAAQAALCTRPSATSTVDAGGGSANPFPAYAQVMPNILAMTLACNLTQVASLQFSQALSPVTHHWLGATQNDTHHNYSHMTPSYFGALYNQPIAPFADIYATAQNAAGQYPQQLVDIETWYAQQVANVAYAFSQVGVGSNGKTLLDQALICWGSEIDMGAAHNHDDTPFVLIGGAGGKLKAPQVGGQLVRFPLNAAIQGNDVAGVRFHNDLLVTLAQVMGVTTAQLQAGYGSSWSSFNSLVQAPIADILT